MRRFIVGLFKFSLIAGFVGALAAIVAAIVLVRGYGEELPDHAGLARYAPPTTTRAHAGDGRVLAEFSREHRLFVPITAIPPLVRGAFLSAEDKSFYSHPGIDLQALTRAVVHNAEIAITGQDRRPVGGSTITQQVAKNFLLTNEVSYERKIKEAVLAFRIERALTKDQILELYLNEIYLGDGAYGVAAAAMTYFGKALKDVSPEEAAFLAALPKAPSNYNPVRNHAAALSRRNWVLERMAEDGRLTRAEAELAAAKPLEVAGRPETDRYAAPWFAEEVRRELLERYGEARLYGGGLSVRATIDPAFQALADAALTEGLEDYDRRHGYRGPIDRIDPGESWREELATVKVPGGMKDRRLAVVLSAGRAEAEIGFEDGGKGVIPYDEARWARPTLEEQKVGARPSRVDKVLAAGDVVAVRAAKQDGKGKDYPEATYALDQIPDIDGAIVAIDPHTGRVLAMSGGYSAERSQFNRATQAARQPGSAIKPFVYLAALEAGYTPSTIVLDAPFVIEIPGKGKWKPANYSGQIYGPSPMRLGLEKSRNLMTVRLAQHIGIEKVIETARRFGVGENMRPELASALGAGEVTLLQLTSAYAMLANGGRKLTPTFIDSVQDRTGHIIFRHDDRVCPPCRGALADPALPPELPDDRPLVAEPMTRYQIVSMMEGVVEHGTGRKVFMAGKPLAGKTGTTNDSFDAWFMGFSSNLAVGVYVGFDQPRTLGAREQGASVAAPIFQAFMEKAWDLKPGGPFKAPPGLEFARVSRTTGLPPEPGDDDVVLEGFLPGTRPETRGVVIGGGLAEDAPTPAPLPAAGAAATDDRAPAAPARPPQRRNLGRVY